MQCFLHMALVLASPGLLSVEARDEEVVRTLERTLKTARPEARRSAVRKLSAIATPKAWACVIDALGDVESMVADEAQLSVAAIDDPIAQACLLGKSGLRSGRGSVSMRSAEALGRSRIDVDGTRLVRAFSSDPALTRTLLWSIERLARSDRLSGDRGRIAAAVRRRARRGRDAGVRAAAVMTLSALTGHGAPAAGLIEAACGDRDPRVRCAGLLAARGLEADAALALACAHGGDDAWSVRLVAIENLERLKSRGAVRALVHRLELEETSRLVDRIVAALRSLSGLKHRRDPRPWRDWAESLEEHWRPSGTSRATPTPDARTTARSFVGLPVLSQRITFLIDFSGSMWMPMADGRIPKDRVDEHMRTVLEGFDPHTHFNVIPFANEPAPWQERLVAARPNHVKRALADFERCNLRGRGNFFDAAVLALADPEVETVTTLTDGYPTGGFHSNLRLIVPLLLERNRFRRIRFDSILVDCPARLRRQWETLATSTGGRSLATDHL